LFRLLLQAQAESIVSFLSSGDKVKQLKQDKAYNLAFLQQEYDIGPQQIDALYNFAKFQFECGNYSGAAEFLYHYRQAHHKYVLCYVFCAFTLSLQLHHYARASGP
jgi:hypothetical protein